MKNVHVLVVGMTDQVGGIETFILNYCEQLAHEGFQFDFLCRFPACSFSERIKKIGGRVFHITRRSKNPARFYWEIYAFFARNAYRYDAIWDNECMFNDITPMYLAKRYGIHIRVCHCHNSDNMDRSFKGRLQELLHKMHRRNLGHIATDFWACSEEAAVWAYPKNILQQRCYRVIRNAIVVEQFGFDPSVRELFREKLGLSGSFVIGHVGRLQYQKNQSFLLAVFRELHQVHQDTILLLVGDGPDREMLQSLALEMGIQDSVRFLGLRLDVALVLQAMDLFVLPSRFEGFGIAAVEAQVSGLPCVLSAQIPRAVQFTENTVFVSSEDEAQWCAVLEKMMALQILRKSHVDRATAAGYDIHSEVACVAALLRGESN